MDQNAAKLNAKLRWEAACERLEFALNPPAGAPADDEVKLDEAVRLVQAALKEVLAAFGDPSDWQDQLTPKG